MDLKELFTSIANAIRNKKETTEKIKASDFPNEIAAIETGIDTSDATATADDIVSGATAYVNGKKIEGNIYKYAEYVGSGELEVYDTGAIIVYSRMPRNSVIPQRGKITLNVGKGYVQSGFGITVDKVKVGETIAGVEGTFTGDADATAEDIASGKTAYVNGEKIVGTASVGGEYNAIMNVDTSATSAGTSLSNRLNKLIVEIPTINISNWTSMSYMFNECQSLRKIPMLDTSNVTNMDNTFYGCLSLTTIPKLNTSNVTNMNNTFYNCKALIEIPQLDTSNVTTMRFMFSHCGNITTIPQLDTSSVTNMDNIFDGCEKLTTIPQLDTSNVTSMNNIFNNCKSLATIPQLDTSSVTSMSYMFGYCSSLSELPQLDTSNVTIMNNFIYNSSIEKMPLLDCSKVTSFGNEALRVSSNVKNKTFGGFKNYGKAFVQKSTNYSSYKMNLAYYAAEVDHDSLMNVINNLYDLNLTYDVANGGTLYTQSLALGSNNRAKLTGEEIAIATTKGWSVS